MSRLAVGVCWLALVCCSAVSAEPVQVRSLESPARGSLLLKNLDGKVLANGDLVQTVRDSEVTVRLVFRFADGSLHDETAVFSQDGVFRLLGYHLVQNGPSFRWTLDMTMTTRDGRVVVRHKPKDSEEEMDEVKLDLAADVANGMMPAVLRNLRAGSAAASFVAATPGPRPVKLAISAAGSEVLSSVGPARRATHYVVKAHIGGLAGVLAPLVGKQPPDTHVWIFEGEPPTFAKSEGPLFYGGPIWRIELTSLVSP